MAQFDIPTLSRPVYRRDTEPIFFTIYEPGTYDPDTGTGTRQNITGWDFTYSMKADASNATALLTKRSSDGGITITDPINGEGRINIESTDLTLNYATTLYTGLYMEDPAGNAETQLLKVPYNLGI